jgi:hypothetical protein
LLSYIGDKDEKGRYQAVKGKREKFRSIAKRTRRKFFPTLY